MGDAFAMTTVCIVSLYNTEATSFDSIQYVGTGYLWYYTRPVHIMRPCSYEHVHGHAVLTIVDEPECGKAEGVDEFTEHLLVQGNIF